VFTDDELEALIDDYVAAAKLAAAVGFDFVDLKCCHGYLGHELLSGFSRPGRFGGSFENRTRFIRELIGRVGVEVPDLAIGVRLSAFDFVPYEDDSESRQGNKKGAGIPAAFGHALPYRYAFGVNPEDPTEYDLSEPCQLLEMFEGLGVDVINVSCGSPYYNPHIQRPAMFPPSDGYQPPEDPLVGVARQIDATRQLKERFPSVKLVGTGYTYLQEFLPNVAQSVVREGWADSVGIGRMVLSYPQMPIDSLQKGELETKRICRTFSDCTTAPRKGLRSGCYPLDDEYKQSDQGQTLKELKRAN
jgi:2,4-dienoyl-CoA reductase-like NADH-dependent reductase (Old Yellow Enzyme family)